MADMALLLKEIEMLPSDYIGEMLDFIAHLPHKVPLVEKTRVVETTAEPNVFDEAAKMLGYKNDLDYLRSNTPATLEEAEAEAERKFNDPKNKNWFDKYYGILAGDEAYGDGMDYQRKMRDEWGHRA